MSNYRGFGVEWFRKHQDLILGAANSPWTGRLFRHLMCVDSDKRLVGMGPSTLTWETGDRLTTQFHTNEKYARRMYHSFLPIWWAMHGFDSLLADRYFPRLSFGFDTLTRYPDGHTGTNSCDGWVRKNWITDFATTRAASTGDDHSDIAALNCQISISNFIDRSFMLYYTSSLTSTAIISAATLSLMNDIGAGWVFDTNTPERSSNVYSSTPAAVTSIALGDYSQVGNTALCDTATSSTVWAALSGYHDYALNASGISNISKTATSKFSWRMKEDADGTAGTGRTYHICRQSSESGTSKDPKLTVTYTIPAYYRSRALFIG